MAGAHSDVTEIQTPAIGVPEIELQKLLSSELLRSERHKMNYETLKEDHQRLKNDYAVLQIQVNQLLDEKRQMQEANMEALQKSQKELIHTKALIEDLKHKISTPNRTELQRMKSIEEIHQKYMHALTAIEEENLNCRSQYHKLCSEYAFVKSEFENREMEMANQLHEMKVKCEKEISVLKNEKEDIQHALINDKSKLTDMITSLQKEKLKLNHQLCGLMQELQEIKLALQQTKNEASDVEKQSAKQIVELSSMLKELNLEKASLVIQNKHLQQNLQDLKTSSTELKRQLTELSSESNQVRRKLDETERKANTEIATFKAILSKRKLEFGEDLDKLVRHIQERAVKENETLRHWQSVHQEEMKTVMKLEEEKHALNVTCQKLKNHVIQLTKEKDEEKAKYSNHLLTLNESHSNLRQEIVLLKTKLKEQDGLVDELAEKESDIGTLRSQINKLKQDLQVMCNVESRLVSSNQELNTAIKAAHEELLSYKNHERRSARTQEYNRQESKLKQEKQDLKLRMSKLKQQIKTLKQKLQYNEKMHKTKTARYGKLITKLRNRIQLHNAKILEMEAENESLKKFVPSNIHSQVKRQLHELQRRHEQYRKLLQTYHLFGGEAISSSLAPILTLTEQEVQQHEFLKDFQDRLKQLQVSKG